MPKEEAKKGEESKSIVKTSEIILKVKDKSTAESLKVYDSKKWSEDKKEIKFIKKISPKENGWRLIHDGEKVLHLFKSDCETHTIYELFYGSLEDCQKEIDKLGLKRK